jgi:protease-4
MIKRIFQILSADWLIHQDTALSYIPVMVAFINGQKVILENASKTESGVSIVTFNQGTGEMISTVRRWQLDDPNIPENSVAILKVDGPILAEDTMCLLSGLKAAEANPNINAIILQTNSPGGMVQGIDLLAGTIKTLTKPTISVITGMAASAAMWISSATHHRIATSKLDIIGSVGAKATIRDLSGLWEKLGIKSAEVYATLSTKKDEEHRAFKDGNLEPIVKTTDFINEVFHQAIRENLGIDASSEVFTGATFFAEQAIELGLIDEINTPEYALEFAYQLGLANKIKLQSNQFKF